MHAHSVVVLNQRRWQSLGGQHGKGVDGLLKKVSFQKVKRSQQMNTIRQRATYHVGYRGYISSGLTFNDRR